MKGLFGSVALATLMLAASTLEANEASYTVERFEWTKAEGCVAVGNNGTQREVIGGVMERECASVTKLTNVQVDYTHATDGTGFMVRMTSPQITPFTCWYNADGVTTACQDQ